jgi:RNA polymerase sigma-70 factor (sigma-E family)
MNADAERNFVSFVEARSHSLFRTAMALAGDRQHAEDLLQSVLAKAYRRWSRIEGRPEAYLRKAMYRQQVSWWRRAVHRREVTAAHPPDRAASGDPEARVDLGLALQAALRRLAPKYRAVLVLRYLEDLPDHEIARILDCKPSTVRSQAARALRQLRTICHDLDDLVLDEVPSRTHAQEAG